MIHINNTIGTLKDQISMLDIIEQMASERSSSNNKNIIEISINSNGGDVQEAFNIYNYLKSTGKEIHTYSQEICNSAATIVFLAGNIRIANCNIGIHNPFVQNISGDSQTLAQHYQHVMQVTTELCDFYSQHTGLPPQAISALMSNCTMMTPEQAIRLGFATENTHFTEKNNYETNNKDLIISNTINTSKTLNTHQKSNQKFNIMKNTKISQNQTNQQKPVLTLLTEFMKKLKSPIAQIKPENQDENQDKLDKIIFLLQILSEKHLQYPINIDPENSVYNPDHNNNPNLSSIYQELETLVTELIETVQQQQQTISQLEEKLTEYQTKIEQDATILNKLNIVGGAEKVLAMFSSNYQPQTRRTLQESFKNCPMQERIRKLKSQK